MEAELKAGFENFKALFQTRSGQILIAIIVAIALVVVSVFKIRLWKARPRLRPDRRIRSWVSGRRTRFRRFRNRYRRPSRRRSY